MCHGIDFAVEFRPCPTDALFEKHSGLALGKACDRLLEQIRDRSAPEFGAAVADDVGFVHLWPLIAFKTGRIHGCVPLVKLAGY